MKKKNVTIDDLAVMVKKGFDGVDKRFDQMLEYVDKRFDRIEKLLIEDHRRRIEKLENQVQGLRDLLAVK